MLEMLLDGFFHDAQLLGDLLVGHPAPE